MFLEIHLIIIPTIINRHFNHAFQTSNSIPNGLRSETRKYYKRRNGHSSSRKKQRGQYFVTVSRKSALEGEGESGRR
ncbi:hypothetical protein Peur_003001 [Populus x canadensis]